MLKEVLIVEGKSDTAAVRRAVEADCIETGGFHFSKRTLQNISAAYEKRGIIILTDPDSAGENIRNFLSKKFPASKHAYIPRDEGTANNDVGIEQAAHPREEFTAAEMFQFGLAGGANSSTLRDKIGAALGIGYGNVKIFVKRLNNYGVTRAEFMEAFKNVAPVDS